MSQQQEPPDLQESVQEDQSTTSLSEMDDDDINNNNNNNNNNAPYTLPPLPTFPSPFPTAPDASFPPPKLPVDRMWIQKLLQKHDKNNNNSNNTDGVRKTDSQQEQQKLHAYVLAPMVDQSDLAFRILCRRYGTNLCFTPMIHTKLYCTSEAYRRKFNLHNNPEQDRPLIAQICGGSDPEMVLQCCLDLQSYCDGIDINCGCPQSIAKRGNYGAFLLEQKEHLIKLTKYLLAYLSVPLTIKVRLLPGETRQESIDDSLALYTDLVDAGVHLLTVHGRTRFNKGLYTGQADWDAIRIVNQRFGDRIPIFANGSVDSLKQAQECLAYTGCDGVLSAEAILEYPPLFSTNQQQRIGRLQLATEYLQLATKYPPHVGGQGSAFKCLRMHLHRFLHADLVNDLQLRQAIVCETKIEGLWKSLEYLKNKQAAEKHDVSKERLSWYMRHRELVFERESNDNDDDDDFISQQKQHQQVSLICRLQARRNHETAVASVELVDDAADCFACLFAES